MAEELPSVIPQSQGSSTKKRGWKKEKVGLEDYLHLLHSRHTLHLTVNQLNQVIRIHGFKKIHHAPKKVLVQAVESLDLVDVPRSTLRDSVSALAAVAVEDVVADLAEMKWQECCVTSMERISLSEGQSVLAASSDQSFRDLIPEDLRRSLKATKIVPKRKRSKVPALDSAASTVDSASLASC